MIARLTILLAQLLFCAINVLAQWDIDNSETLEFANGPVEKHLAIDNAGTLHAVFRQGNFLNYYWREPDAETWHGPEVVNDSLSMSQLGDFALACNPDNGAAHVAYTSNNHVWYSWRSGTNIWTRSMINDPNEPAVTPDIAVNATGQLYIVYVIEVADVYQLEIAYNDGSAEWVYDIIPGDLGAFGSGASPRVGIDGDGAGHVIFRAVGGTGYKVQHATNNEPGGTGWDLTDLQVPHPESYPGDLAVEPNGTVHCVTQGSEGFGMPRPVYYHSRTPQGAWSFGNLASGMQAAGDPVVAYDTQHGGHAMWLPLSGNFYTGEIFYSGATTNWTPEYIYDNISAAPAFVIDSDNFGHLLLENGGGEVLYLRSDEPLAGAVGDPAIEITPANIDFDSVEVGEDSVVAVRLENTGEATLTIQAFDVIGTGFSGPPQWIVVNLEPGAFMTTEVQFTPQAEQSYLGRVLVWSNAASSPDTIRLSGRGWVFIDDAPDVPLPNELALHPLYPNPFNGAANVSFSLAKAGDVTLNVYDVLGREVGSLLKGRMTAGEHQVQWICAECAAGVYLFKLNAAGQTLVQKAVFQK